MENEQKQLWERMAKLPGGDKNPFEETIRPKKFDPLLWVFMGSIGLVGIAILIRSGLAMLLLAASSWLAWDEGFNLASSVMVLSFVFMFVGELPLYFSKTKVPKIKYTVLGLIVSIMWLLFAGLIIYGMVFSDLKNHPLYWLVAVAIVLADLPALLFCTMFLVPKSRRFISEEFEKLDEKLEKARENRGE